MKKVICINDRGIPINVAQLKKHQVYHVFKTVTGLKGIGYVLQELRAENSNVRITLNGQLTDLPVAYKCSRFVDAPDNELQPIFAESVNEVEA